jgi:endonuclease YncB( thermonuclease family)
MKKLIFLIFFITISNLGYAKNHVSFSGKVVGVSDGDTISVIHNGTAEKIRLHGIDCPEKKQDFGNRAKQYTSEMCFGQIATVLVVAKDRYGRSVGIVTVNDKNLNQELVRAGLAWWYVRYAPRDVTLRKLEEQARFYKRGLWIQPNAIPPWEFRRS